MADDPVRGSSRVRSSPTRSRRSSTAFLVNVRLFLIAEVFILILALVIAVLRSLPGPVFFPFRAARDRLHGPVPRDPDAPRDLHCSGSALPALGSAVVLDAAVLLGDRRHWSSCYSAYVAEVYRAGIESVHRVQVAAARSLGLSRWQSLRFVVLPQAVRRVIPPLLNDFIGLQKDTALLAVLGVDRGVPAGADQNAATVQLLELRGRGVPVRPDDDPVGPAHRLVDRTGSTPRDKRRRRHDRGGPRSRASGSPSASSRCCGASTSWSRTTRSSA